MDISLLQCWHFTFGCSFVSIIGASVLISGSTTDSTIGSSVIIGFLDGAFLFGFGGVGFSITASSFSSA